MDMSLEKIIKTKKIAEAPAKKFGTKKAKARPSRKQLNKQRAQASIKKFKSKKPAKQSSKGRLNKIGAQAPSKKFINKKPATRHSKKKLTKPSGQTSSEKFEGEKPVQLSIAAKMDMSLDDIIKSEKITQAPSKKFATQKPTTRLSNRRLSQTQSSSRNVGNKKPVIRHSRKKLNKPVYNEAWRNNDARFKILERNGAKIRDARDILNEQQQNIRLNANLRRGCDLRRFIKGPSGGLQRSRQNYLEIARGSRLRCTIDNDIAFKLVSPAARRLNSWQDPFNVYEFPPSTSRHSLNTHARLYRPEQASSLSQELQSRLERPLNQHTPTGIFSNPYKTSSSKGKNSSKPTPSAGYGIIVSNLPENITLADVQELFGDVGELLDLRVVRPGVAEVFYKSLSDTLKAIDTYHGRYLDGQPMQCLLVKPRVFSLLSSKKDCLGK